MDNSIEKMETQLKDLLKSFKKVLLFSKKNPFNLQNLQHYNLDTYMIKNSKRIPQKRRPKR